MPANYNIIELYILKLLHRDLSESISICLNYGPA